MLQGARNAVQGSENITANATCTVIITTTTTAGRIVLFFAGNSFYQYCLSFSLQISMSVCFTSRLLSMPFLTCCFFPFHATFCPLAASDSVRVCSKGPAVPSRGQKTLQLLQIPLLLPPPPPPLLLLRRLRLRLLLLRLRLRLLLLELFGSLLPIVSSVVHGQKRV